MLSLVEKLEDLKAGLNNDTYIDVILQSLPPSYDPFIVNYNMNGLEKGKKGKGTAVTATASTGGAPPAAPKGKGKGKVGGSQRLKEMMSACIAKERGIGRGSVHNSSPTQVLQRSRKLRKDEMILRLGDGKAVAAEVIGSLRWVVSSHIRIDLKDLYFVPSMVKNIISILMLGKMTKKPFVGQSAIANGLLDLVHTDVCGPLSILARGGFSYFITFTDDHSRYGYIYLMRYKSEAFGRFKEYRLEVENQTNRKIKAIRSDRGDEYLSGEFIDYLKENGILSQWTPPGTPQLNGVAERRNRTLLDMTPYEIWYDKSASYKYLRVWGSPAYVKTLVGDKLDSRSSLCRFIGYPKETARYYFYDPAEQKIFVSRNIVFLEKGFPLDSRHDEVLIEESNEEPHRDTTTSFEPTVHTDSVPVLRRSTRESRVPDRYGFVGLTSQLDNDPKTYGEAMSDIDWDKWLEAMKSKMDSMGSNQVWTLVDPPKGTRPVGCKWVYKCKLGADGEVTTFKARLVAKGYTQRPGVDFEETYSPVAIAKSIRILLAIAAWYDYEIWQMDVKTTFLNGFVEEEIFMDQPEGFTAVGEEQKVCHLQRSIYGLKQASRSWNTRFDEVIRGYDFIKNDYDPCV
ncbi:UNVERIFIED_CONTAM: Retrovirus-related Pol polyprotein from transposon RE2 [Sesamum radiatum]|uniref:Retrovirus-related Pol polyprotein from transposon RE2 n=1 Tax=Sesamum radiatum TaxID=300843 RepID=A0AAW2IUQ5_SESRA